MTEFSYASSCPPVRGTPSPLSELDKARYAAQSIVTCVGLDITCLWDETFQTQANLGIGLLRNTVTADPLPSVQPEVIYYVQRTLCTLLGDVWAAALLLTVVPQPQNAQVWGFVGADGDRLAALWLNRIAPTDPTPRQVVDVVIEGPVTHGVVGVDVLNGREQELQTEREVDHTLVRAVALDDFPIMLRF